MKLVTCAFVEARLDAFVDDELSGVERRMVSEHIDVCRSCAQEEESVRALGEMLRGAAAMAPSPADELDGLAAGVISRVKAEEQQSWRATFDRAIDDWHWVVVGVGAVTAAFVSVMLASVIVHSATLRRDDSLSALMTKLSAPAGTLFIVATLEGDPGDPVLLQFQNELAGPGPDMRMAMPATFVRQSEQALMVALDASLMRDGRVVSHQDVLGEDRTNIDELLAQISRLRFTEPSRSMGGPMKVRAMLLVTSTFVSAKRPVGL